MAASVEGITLPSNLTDSVGNMTNKEIGDILTSGFEKNQLIWEQINKSLADKRMQIVNQKKQDEILEQLRINYDFEKGQERTKLGKVRESISITWEKLLKSKWFERASDSFKKMLGFLGAINVTPGPFTIFRKKVFNDLSGTLRLCRLCLLHCVSIYPQA